MNVPAIQECIAQLKAIINKPNYDGWQLWRLTDQFQNHWDIEARDFKQMWLDSFKINSPLWLRDGYYPVKSMTHYIEMNDEMVRAIFADLFNEKRDLAGRINRFLYQCEILYKEDRANTQKVMPHYHDDRKMIHTYLAFRYPESYSLYNFEYFKAFMSKIGSKSVPHQDDIDRFVKACNILKTFLLKDEELIEIVHHNTEKKDYSMLLVFELYSLVYEYNFN